MPTVFVTGANRGLGLEFVRQYAANGWDVLAAARDPGRADELNALAAGSGGRVEVVRLDVADGAGVARVARDLGGRPIDLVVNNAGVWGGERQHLPDIDFDAWLRTLQVNTLGRCGCHSRCCRTSRPGGRGRSWRSPAGWGASATTRPGATTPTGRARRG
jgi:NAD(P)-dependent dehydrogenase (short-subunit alcohol dehydrogenase family)